MKSFTDGAELSPALIIDKDNKRICLIQGQTEVVIITDKSEYDEDYSGLITFVNEDGISIENQSMIIWEYIEELDVIKL